jgi:hypothetical protein
MSDFSSDHILENYRSLNEIGWIRDADVCIVCGMRFDEIGNECIIPVCPQLSEPNINEDDE